MGAGPRLETAAVPVAEQRHRLRCAHQQVGCEPPGGQHPGEVLGRGALVPEQPQVPGRLAERVRHLAEVEQTRVRVGRVGEPAQQDGEQGALDGGLAGDAGGQRLQVAQGGGGVGVAEGDHAFPGRLGAEPGLAGGELGDRVQQRPVEQLLVQPAYDGGVPLPLAQQFGDRVGAQPEGAADAAQLGLLLGHEVGAAQPEQLDPVLHGAQEPVGLVELRGVGPAHVAAGGEGPQRVEGRTAAQGGVGPAVHQLEQLHGELDVPEAARAEFQLAVDLGGGDVLHHPAAHLLHVRHEVLALGGLPHQGLDRGHVLLAELQVARDRAGLEQRLELPGLGPALVVGEVAGEGPHQRTVSALGPEVGVNRPDGPLDRRLGTDPHQVRGQPGRGAQGLGLVGLLGGLRHEDDVHVGDVVELMAAALAHRDDREPAQRVVLGRGGPREAEGGAQGGGGEVGELGGGLGDAGGTAHVPGGDGQQAAPVGDAQGDGVVRLREAGLELLHARVQVVRLVHDERLPVLRVPGEVVGEGGGGAEHPEQPVAQRLGRDQRVEQFPARARVRLRLQQPDEPEEREIRVGGRAQRVQQHRVVAQRHELGTVQEPLGGGGVGEPVPQQPCEGTAPAPRRRRHSGPPSVSPRSFLGFSSDQGRTALSLTADPGVDSDEFRGRTGSAL